MHLTKKCFCEDYFEDLREHLESRRQTPAIKVLCSCIPRLVNAKKDVIKEMNNMSGGLKRWHPFFALDAHS